MATAAPITGAPAGAPIFRINGVSNPVDEPYPFLDQLHGILCCIQAAVEDDSMPLNGLVMAQALRGAQTLAYLVGQGLAHQDAEQEARRHGA
jgi:hypothetical protein